MIMLVDDDCVRIREHGGHRMPPKTEKQRKFMGAKLGRKRAGKKTRTGMSEKKLEKMASRK